MSIDDSSREPVYVQLARIIRDRAIGGAYELGAKVPSENDLVGEFGVNRETARAAYRLLAEEGMILSRRGLGTFLVALPPRRELVVAGGDVVAARMPGPGERRDLGLAPGVPVLVITRRDGRTEKHGASGAIVRAVCDDPAPAG